MSVVVNEINGLGRGIRLFLMLVLGLALLVFVLSFLGGCSHPPSANQQPVRINKQHFGGYAAMLKAQKQAEVEVRHE